MQLAPSALAAGWAAKVLDSCVSTNAEALALGAAGENRPTWVVARTQSHGRARRGRSWVSAPGNLYTSLLLPDPSRSGCAAQLSFVSALAVRDAIATAAPEHAARLTLKWPNDVLCDGRKIAGLLLEGQAGKLFSVVIGIGVNCRHHPEGTEFAATDLAAAGIGLSSETLFGLLSASMLARIGMWDRGAGFAGIRSDWLATAAGLGGPVRVRLENRELTGQFEALDAEGHLLLRLPDGRRETIAAGDVFPLGAA
jgi:BirA family transcriptional regulator, biotin operon repressor / biotin---[acetyl-CoA-carboxylase] ligase